LESADLGYNIIGSDVGGYHGKSPIDPELYIRWAQFSAFSGLFLNGGHDERRMWQRSKDELEIVRTFAWIHDELVPYMYHFVVTAHEGGRRLITPVDSPNFHYFFGDDILVAPIHQPGGTQTVHLPGGRWRYWFDDTDAIQGPAEFTREFPLDEYPVYIREGAIIPMRIARNYSGIGDRDWAQYLTLNIFPDGETEFTFFDLETQAPGVITCTAAEQVSVRVEGIRQPCLLRIFHKERPTEIALDGVPLESAAWDFLPEAQRVIIRCAPNTAGTYTLR